MNPDERRVAEFIRSAFHGVTLGNGVGLLQGQGLDDYADEKTLQSLRAQDEKVDWSRLAVDQLDRCHSSLSFFDAEGMRFHLPAYLVADLEGALKQDVIFHLTYLVDGALSRFDLLSLSQREAVRQFLRLRLETGDSFLSSHIQAALDAFWDTSVP